MASGNSARRLRNADLQVDRSAKPGWESGETRTPRAGEIVYCTEGKAEVVRVLGRTGDGSRLLELRLLEKTAPPFFAAASNVLVRPVAEKKAEAGTVRRKTRRKSASDR